MARWTQPHEIREYARVAHAFIDAMVASTSLLVIARGGKQRAGRLVRSSMSQEPQRHPPMYAGEFTIEDERGGVHTFDILDVQDVYPLFTAEEAARSL